MQAGDDKHLADDLPGALSGVVAGTGIAVLATNVLTWLWGI